MCHYTSSDLCGKRSSERRTGVLKNLQDVDPRLGLCLPGTPPSSSLLNTLSSQDTSAPSSPPPHTPSPLPSPAWLSEPILSLSHLSVNLRKITCTVYIIYIWFLWFSVTLTSWCATYLLTYLPTYLHNPQTSTSSSCNSSEEQPPVVVRGKMDGKASLSSCRPRGEKKGWYRQTEVSSHCLLPSPVIIPQRSGVLFPTLELLLDENLFKKSAKKEVALISLRQLLLYFLQNTAGFKVFFLTTRKKLFLVCIKKKMPDLNVSSDSSRGFSFTSISLFVFSPRRWLDIQSSCLVI